MYSDEKARRIRVTPSKLTAAGNTGGRFTKVKLGQEENQRRELFIERSSMAKGNEKILPKPVRRKNGMYPTNPPDRGREKDGICRARPVAMMVWRPKSDGTGQPTSWIQHRRQGKRKNLPNNRG
jgi:hypothetical protein